MSQPKYRVQLTIQIFTDDKELADDACNVLRETTALLAKLPGVVSTTVEGSIGTRKDVPEANATAKTNN